MISPSFVLPFLLINIGTLARHPHRQLSLLHVLGAVMTLYGLYVCYLMLRRPRILPSRRTTFPGRTCIE